MVARAVIWAIAALLVNAADSGTWDTSNNKVTYSVSAENTQSGEGATVKINLSQFNTSIAVEQEGAKD